MKTVLRVMALLGLVLIPGCSQEFRTTAGGSGTDASVLRRESPFGVVVSSPKGSGGAVASDGGDDESPRHALSTPRESLDASPAPTARVTEGAGGATPEDAAIDVADAMAHHDAAPEAPCGKASAGPGMVAIETPSGASYCIDETEVTVGDYAAFLATNPPTTFAPAAVCAWKTSFIPAGTFPPSGSDANPVTQVDWCDAAAYCSFAGKRLCGSVDGGANAYTDYAKPTDEWYFACTAGGKTTFPYGSAFDPSACVGLDYDGVSGFQSATDLPHPVGTATRCHGSSAPFDALHDMAGNVAEWEDSCASTGGTADYCHVRGDSYHDGNGSTMACGYAPRMTRSYRAAFIGFRCCL